MTNRDYTKEVGLKSSTPKVSWPIAVAVLALSGAGLCYGALKLNRLPSRSTSHGAAERPAETPAASSTLARGK